MLKMAKTIRTQHFLNTNGIEGTADYIKQLYIKNKYWNPPPASNRIEESIMHCEKQLKQAQRTLQIKYKNSNLSNLTPLQTQVLNSLKKNPNIIIKPTDKNLGTAAMDLTKYIQQILQEHLLTKDYRQLTKDSACNEMEKIKCYLKSMISANRNLLPKAELIYFQRSFQLQHRLPIFYGLPKVHKNPISLRSVVSNTNSFLAIFSVWLDHIMKDLLPLVRSHIKNSTTLISQLKQLPLPAGAKIFTADAVSMYTNIDTTLGMDAIRQFLITNENDLTANFPVQLFLSILETVMRNNIFSFGETYWIQEAGTAMGTPVACTSATITFGNYENTIILPEFQENLLYYHRYIDDVFGIWIPPRYNPTRTWETLKHNLTTGAH
jgi:hypothetical protein